jgi:SnoaL-like domain
MRSGVARERPDAEIMAPIERIARFMETLDSQFLDDAFAGGEVVLIENFSPYVFEGSDAVARWAKGFAKHAKNIGDLRHSFGDAQDFHLDGELAFLSIPTTWRGTIGASSFIETGGWAFVLVKHAGGWRVRNYGWAVTGIAISPIIDSGPTTR